MSKTSFTRALTATPSCRHTCLEKLAHLHDSDLTPGNREEKSP